MVFTSFRFLGFFAVVFCLYFLTAHRYRWMILLGASLAFYLMWQPVYLLQLAGAAAVAWQAAIRMEAADNPAHKKRYLTAAILLLVGNLLVFKYTGFLNESLRTLCHSVNLLYEVPVISILLPVGISFYTFQLLSYVLDVYDGRTPAERHWGIFGLYVSFFPKLIAGPIERAADLIPQFRTAQDLDYERVRAGMQWMAWGFFKKLVVADRLAPMIASVYDKPQDSNGVSLVIATVLFAFQVYCDFSGYTDIAIGAAQTLGISLTANFNQPYSAVSIQDFWKRWHISLSNWLTTYLYTPLARSRALPLKWYHMMLVSIFLTFLTSGLWHGSQWTFVTWGALHGAYLVASMLTQKLRRRCVQFLHLDKSPALHRQVRVVITFGLVCIGYVFFRANSMADATYIFAHLFTGWTSVGSTISDILLTGSAELLVGLGGLAVLMRAESGHNHGNPLALLATRPLWVRGGVYYALATAILVLGAFYGNDAQQFIYFQF